MCSSVILDFSRVPRQGKVNLKNITNSCPSALNLQIFFSTHFFWPRYPVEIQNYTKKKFLQWVRTIMVTKCHFCRSSSVINMVGWTSTLNFSTLITEYRLMPNNGNMGTSREIRWRKQSCPAMLPDFSLFSWSMSQCT